MLTGDRTDVDEAVQEFGYDNLDDFAVELGGQSEYSNVLVQIMSRFGERAALSVTGGGLVSSEYPGVINLPLLSYMIGGISFLGGTSTALALSKGIEDPRMAAIGSLLLATNSYYALQSSIALPNSLTHELCHYLSQDSDRTGLIPIRYKNEEE